MRAYDLSEKGKHELPKPRGLEALDARVDRGSRFQVSRFQVKRIMVEPKGRLLLQKHHSRAEHGVVVKGRANVTVDQTVSLGHENGSVYLPIKSMHRLTNPGRMPLEMVEVQAGRYMGKDGSIRFEDVHGR